MAAVVGHHSASQLLKEAHRLRGNASDAAVFCRLGRIFVQRSKFQSAFRALRQCVKLEPSGENWFWMGLAVEKHDPSQSLATYEAAVSADPLYMENVVSLGRHLKSAGRQAE